MTKVSVGLAVALFGCTSGNGPGGTPGTAGTNQGTAGQSTGGSTGTAGTNQGTAGQTGGSPGTAGQANGGAIGTAGSMAGAMGTAGGAAGATGGSMGTAGGGAGAGGTPVLTDDVLERGKRPSRDGNYVQPTLTPAAAMKMGMDTAFNTAASFTGMMFSSPLYLAKGPVTGKGIFIAATTNNDVVAFDDTGAMAWKRNITPNPAKSGGSLSPRGIMGTPVIDSTLGADGFPTIYVCGPGAATPGGVQDRYELHAISAKDGTERAGGWPAKLDATVKATNDGLNRAFNPTIEAQRPALSLVNGIVYIGFGGPFGDFGATYYGWVIAVDKTDPTKIGAWSTRGGGGAIWSPGGFSSDGDGVLVTTGNAYGGVPATYSDSEGVIRLSGIPIVKKDAYWPVRFKQMDTDDQDMSSSSVLLLNVPGATPANYAITESKDAHLYFLDASKLGAATGGGELVDMTLTNSNHSARISPVSYTTATGIHIAVTVDRGPYLGCPANSTADGTLAALIGLTVTPGSPATVAINWCTPIGGPTSADGGTIRNRSASPLVTTTDGHANPILWIAGSASQTATNTPATVLKAIDGETGAVLYSGGNCAGIRQWTTPIAVKGHIVLGGDAKLCSWSPQP
ncbi:MAG TPA: hypothetical protein VHL80_02015 [Polyangia bacterium]|nr:hypothetical protein [Polyangia bacterium]